MNSILQKSTFLNVRGLGIKMVYILGGKYIFKCKNSTLATFKKCNPQKYSCQLNQETSGIRLVHEGLCNVLVRRT